MRELEDKIKKVSQKSAKRKRLNIEKKIPGKFPEDKGIIHLILVISALTLISGTQ
jgi:hypothetical protein